MLNIKTESLAETLDSINDAFFHNSFLTFKERTKAAKWITGLQGKPGSYAGMFAPTEADFTNGAKLYTGESITSRAATGHILGEEACRALIILDVKDTAVKNALDLATQNMLQRLRLYETESEVVGRYCCGTCTAAYLRHVLVGGLDRNEERLAAGLKFLRSSRTGKGRWRFFPFYYTLLLLSEMDLTMAKDEIKYATPALERGLARIAPAEKYAERRHILTERLLGRC